ncbi:MAG: DUF370 domain-containing protein [Oscillospiraceae bacterium]|nr:DUF370 domain-containing protein [Oscillospiraceae bacterium]
MLVNVGFGNMVNCGRIIAVVSPETAPIKRLVQDAKDESRVIDVTCGRRTRSVIITDSDHVILSALKCETISNKMAGQGGNENSEDAENAE